MPDRDDKPRPTDDDARSPAGEDASDQYQTFDPNAAVVDTRASTAPAEAAAADPYSTAAPPPPPAPDTTTDPYATTAPGTAPQANRAADPYQTVDPSAPATDPNQTIDPSAAPVPASRAGTATDDDFWPTDDRPPLPTVPGYEILGILGQGGMGVVYRARQQGLKRLVALKMIRNAALAGAADLARFQIEAEALATLQHPNIVQIYEVGKVDNLPYFSLEYVDGGCLAKSVGREPQEARWSAEMMVTLSRAMLAAHTKNIIHRDLKPANVLLGKDGTPKITDFGLAKRVDSGSGQTESGALLGTPCYMAPEQARGDIENTGALADVYALGAMLYEMLTGRPPFLGTSPMETVLQVVNEDPVPPTRLNPKAPRDLETICLKAMHKEQARRYEDAGALADDLKRWLDGEPIVARPASRRERVVKWARRKPWAAVAAGIAVGFVLALVGAGVNAYRNEFLRAQVAEHELQSIESKGKVRDLLSEGKTSLDAHNWQDAERKVDAARELVQSNPALNELGDQVEALAARVNQGRSDRAKVEEFTAHRNEALLRHSQATGQESGDAAATTRREARAALDVFGDAPDAPQAAALKSPYITAPERQAIGAGRYELLLILADAESRADKGQPGKALELLKRARHLGPPTQAYYRRVAHYQKQLGNAAAAEEAERRAEATEPTTAVDFFLLGEQAHHRGDWFSAIVQFERALRREPDYFWAHYYIGLAALNARQYARTEAEMGTCVHLRPKFVWPFLVRALARAELGNQARFDTSLSLAERQRQAQIDFEGGEADLAQAEPALGIVQDDRYNWLVNRGLLRVRAERFADAEKDLQAASKLKPTGVEAYATLAMAFQNQRRWAEAIEQVDAALGVLADLPHSNTTYHRQLSLERQRAFYQRERGDMAATQRDLDTVIAREEKRHAQGSMPASDIRALAQDRYERGRLLYQERRYTDALTDAQRVSALTSGDARATRLQAGIFYELKRYPEAVAAFDAFLGKQNGKRTPGVYAGRGLARWRQRDYRGAIEDFTEALALESDEALGEREMVRLHSDRGWIYLLDGDAPRLALDDFNEVLKLKPDDADALAGRGYARVKTGDYQRAVTDAEEAVRCAPKAARIHYLAARTYAQAADRAEADTRQRLHHDLAVKYETRALALLQQALDYTPAAQRAEYWRKTLRPDRALVPLHRNAAFVRLDKAFAAPDAAR